MDPYFLCAFPLESKYSFLCENLIFVFFFFKFGASLIFVYFKKGKQNKKEDPIITYFLRKRHVYEKSNPNLGIRLLNVRYLSSTPLGLNKGLY